MHKLYAFDKTLKYLYDFRELNTHYNDKIFTCSAEYCSIKSEVFDIIFAIEILEHVVDLEKSILEIYRILKPNGYFHLTVPNKLFPFETHRVNIGQLTVKRKYIPFLSIVDFIDKKIGTARRFSKNDICNLAAKTGFEIVGVEYMMPPFDYWNFSKKMSLKMGSFIQASFLKIFTMTIIVVLKKT